MQRRKFIGIGAQTLSVIGVAGLLTAVAKFKIMQENNTPFDVIIVGGSYAGLSAAMTLGRSLKKVLVIDSGKSCNAQTPHSHNFLT